MNKIFRLFILLSCWLVAPLAATAVELSRPGNLPDGVDPGELKVLNIDGQPPAKTLQLPLQHTDVKITVAGFVARATVTQQYSNPFDKPIEAVYTFPLPHKAAVDGMTMHVGNRTIRGIIKKREEARQIYQQAKTAGRRTALLEQERPNIFTQSVGNIMPGDKILIEISYVDLLAYQDEGAFELVFPMVVGPRYIPGIPQGSTGGGFAQNTDQVPDASHITPPVLKPGERSGHDIALTVDIDAHVKIRGVHSTSHKIDINTVSENVSTVALRPSDTIPNKDFILRYEVAGRAPEVAVIAHHTPETGGYFTFIALPQKHIDDSATVPRDLIFILDTSGSMSGQPLEQSKQAMSRLLTGMRAEDRFNIIRFAGDTGTLWPEPRQNTQANLAQANSFVASLRGMGGTEMRKGIIEALSQPAEAGRMRIAFLLTDGYVGNESGILASIEKERRGARIFTLGVGSSVNRYLLDQAATVGLGEAFYIRQDEDATGVIDKFFKRVDRPNLAHLQIDWKGLDVFDLTPARIPDLWEGQPVLVHGRYKLGGHTNVGLKGVLGAEELSWSLDVNLPTNAPENEIMATVWARAKVRELMLARARNGGRGDEKIAEITNLGLQYRIMTQWTSFVAVEESIVNEGGKQRKVLQPVELPEGLNYDGIFGDENENDAATAPAFLAGSRSLAAKSSYGLMSRPRPKLRSYAPAAPPAPPAAMAAPAPGLGAMIGSAIGAFMGNSADMASLAENQSGISNFQAPNAMPYATVTASPETSAATIKEEYKATASNINSTASASASATASATATQCNYRYVGLSVSGELRYGAASSSLRKAWPEFCVKLQRKYQGALILKVTLTVDANGTVNKVVVSDSHRTIAQSFIDLIKNLLQHVKFPIATGTSRIELVLLSK